MNVVTNACHILHFRLWKSNHLLTNSCWSAIFLPCIFICYTSIQYDKLKLFYGKDMAYRVKDMDPFFSLLIVITSINMYIKTKKIKRFFSLVLYYSPRVFCPSCKIHQGAFFHLVTFWPRGFCPKGLLSVSRVIWMFEMQNVQSLFVRLTYSQ